MARIAINDEGFFPGHNESFTGIGITEYVVYNNTGSTVKILMSFDDAVLGVVAIDKRGNAVEGAVEFILGEKETMHLVVEHADVGTHDITFSGEAAHRGPISTGMRHNPSDLAISGLFIGQVA